MTQLFLVQLLFTDSLEIKNNGVIPHYQYPNSLAVIAADNGRNYFYHDGSGALVWQDVYNFRYTGF